MPTIAVFAWLLVATAVYNPSATNAQGPCGADWEPYHDEHCFKVFTDSGQQTFSSAASICSANSAHLPVLHYAEEQNFLTEYLFKRSKLAHSVWLGGKLDATGKLQWTDSSPVTYTNWAKDGPKHVPGECLQLHYDAGHQGHWLGQSCSSKNSVVCQRHQPRSREALEETVLLLKHSLVEMQSKLGSLEQSYSETKASLSKLETKSTQEGQQLAQTEGKLVQAEKKLHEMEQSLAKLAHQHGASSSVPIGFIYAQLAKEKAPAEIWPDFTWTDISSHYAGLFFRVLGGHAAAFGKIQEANSTHISEVQVNGGTYDEAEGATVALSPGSWSEKIFTGGNSAPTVSWSLYTTGGENRPRNMAMKVWKRTA